MANSFRISRNLKIRWIQSYSKEYPLHLEGRTTYKGISTGSSFPSNFILILSAHTNFKNCYLQQQVTLVRLNVLCNIWCAHLCHYFVTCIGPPRLGDHETQNRTLISATSCFPSILGQSHLQLEFLAFVTKVLQSKK